jgi:hypothetical protein
MKFLSPPMRFDWVALNLHIGRNNLFFRIIECPWSFQTHYVKINEVDL